MSNNLMRACCCQPPPFIASNIVAVMGVSPIVGNITEHWHSEVMHNVVFPSGYASPRVYAMAIGADGAIHAFFEWWETQNTSKIGYCNLPPNQFGNSPEVWQNISELPTLFPNHYPLICMGNIPMLIDTATGTREFHVWRYSGGAWTQNDPIPFLSYGGDIEENNSCPYVGGYYIHQTHPVGYGYFAEGDYRIEENISNQSWCSGGKTQGNSICYTIDVYQTKNIKKTFNHGYNVACTYEYKKERVYGSFMCMINESGSITYTPIYDWDYREFFTQFITEPFMDSYDTLRPVYTVKYATSSNTNGTYISPNYISSNNTLYMYAYWNSPGIRATGLYFGIQPSGGSFTWYPVTTTKSFCERPGGAIYGRDYNGLQKWDTETHTWIAHDLAGFVVHPSWWNSEVSQSVGYINQVLSFDVAGNWQLIYIYREVYHETGYNTAYMRDYCAIENATGHQRIGDPTELTRVGYPAVSASRYE